MIRAFVRNLKCSHTPCNGNGDGKKPIGKPQEYFMLQPMAKDFSLKGISSFDQEHTDLDLRNAGDREIAVLLIYLLRPRKDVPICFVGPS
jgi:hypothetical protein